MDSGLRGRPTMSRSPDARSAATRWGPSSMEPIDSMRVEAERAASNSAPSPTAASETSRFPTACLCTVMGWQSKAPLFVLNRVSDFSIENALGVTDLHRDRVEQESIVGEGVPAPGEKYTPAAPAE